MTIHISFDDQNIGDCFMIRNYTRLWMIHSGPLRMTLEVLLGIVDLSVEKMLSL